MARKRFTAEQIIHKLRLAEVEVAKGKLIPEACRQIPAAGYAYTTPRNH